MCAAQVLALRGGVFVELSSSQLVPGDVVLVSPGTLAADMVLLCGECIVDENMLTGRLDEGYVMVWVSIV